MGCQSSKNPANLISMNKISVQASIISEQAILEFILYRYKLKKPLKCEFFRLGVNDIYCVLSADTLLFLRIYTPLYSDPGAIKREIDLLLALDCNGLSVGTPLADREGQYM